MIKIIIIKAKHFLCTWLNKNNLITQIHKKNKKEKGVCNFFQSKYHKFKNKSI